MGPDCCCGVLADDQPGVNWHKLPQPSSSTLLPSSHCSFWLLPFGAWAMPSPQVVVLQTLHLSVATLLPSSHCSMPTRTLPSPQVLKRDAAGAKITRNAPFALPSELIEDRQGGEDAVAHVLSLIHI